MTHISDELLDKYSSIAAEALEKVKIAAPEGTHLHTVALDFLDMAKRYVKDAKHFREKGDAPRAFGALNYAHGWLDAGARMGLFDVGRDSRLFTVD